MHRIALLAGLVLAAIAVVGGARSSTSAQDEGTPIANLCASPVVSGDSAGTPDAGATADELGDDVEATSAALEDSGTPVGVGTPGAIDIENASPEAGPDADDAEAATARALLCGTPSS